MDSLKPQEPVAISQDITGELSILGLYLKSANEQTEIFIVPDELPALIEFLEKARTYFAGDRL